MPPKKVTLPAFKKIEAKVESLESEILEVRSALAEVQNTVKHNHENLIAWLERRIGKSLSVEEGCASFTIKDSPAGSVKKGQQIPIIHSVQDEISTEFRQSVKKVELPAFDGEDPAGWISRAEVNFRVQNTSPEVKTSLARLCMEGPTIHFFNSHQRGRESVVGPSEGSASGEVWRSLRG
jgi:hypothetical protein